jgi:hypothetical protein
VKTLLLYLLMLLMLPFAVLGFIGEAGYAGVLAGRRGFELLMDWARYDKVGG